MKYEYMSDSEFIKYVCMDRNDPVTQRLCALAHQAAVWSELRLDPDEVEEKIHSLEREIEFSEENAAELYEKITKLEARTVLDMIQDLSAELDANRQQVRNARETVKEADDKVRRAEAKVTEITKKMDMWTILNR